MQLIHEIPDERLASRYLALRRDKARTQPINLQDISGPGIICYGCIMTTALCVVLMKRLILIIKKFFFITLQNGTEID